MSFNSFFLLQIIILRLYREHRDYLKFKTRHSSKRESRTNPCILTFKFTMFRHSFSSMLTPYISRLNSRSFPWGIDLEGGESKSGGEATFSSSGFAPGVLFFSPAARIKFPILLNFGAPASGFGVVGEAFCASLSPSLSGGVLPVATEGLGEGSLDLETLGDGSAEVWLASREALSDLITQQSDRRCGTRWKRIGLKTILETLSSFDLTSCKRWERVKRTRHVEWK